MVSKIGAKEFKNRVKTTLMQIDENIKEDDLFFSQTTSGYYIEYKPEYPNRSNADFIVYQDLAGSISVHGNMSALVPTIEHYENIDDFEQKTLISRTETVIEAGEDWQIFRDKKSGKFFVNECSCMDFYEVRPIAKLEYDVLNDIQCTNETLFNMFDWNQYDFCGEQVTEDKIIYWWFKEVVPELD